MDYTDDSERPMDYENSLLPKVFPTHLPTFMDHLLAHRVQW